MAASTFMQNWPSAHRNLLSVSIVLLLIFLGIAYFIVYPMWKEYDEERSEYEDNEHKVATSQWPRDAERMEGLLNSYKKILGTGKPESGGLRALERVVNTRATSMFSEKIKTDYGSTAKFIERANNTEYKRCYDETSVAINNILKASYPRIKVSLEPEVFRMDVEQAGNIFVNMLRLWTTRRLVEIIDSNNLEIGIDPDYERSGGIRAAKIIAMPVTQYSVTEKEAPYLLEIPVKVEVRGRLDDFSALVADLQNGNDFLPIVHMEIETENPMQRFRGQGMYSKHDQDGHIAIQQIKATIVCSAFFNLESEEAAIKGSKAPAKSDAPVERPVGI
jgi:hypothetical protein